MLADQGPGIYGGLRSRYAGALGLALAFEQACELLGVLVDQVNDVDLSIPGCRDIHDFDPLAQLFEFACASG